MRDAGQQRGRGVRRNRDDHGVGSQAVGRRAHRDAAGVQFDRVDRHARPHIGAGVLQRGRGGPGVEVGERPTRPADVAGRGIGQQPDLEHRRGQGQGCLLGGQVDGRDADEVPQPLDRRGSLAVLA
jgi:hypothetical protein